MSASATAPENGAFGARGVRATRTTTQSIPNSTTTVVGLTSEDYDDDGAHDNATNPSRLTVPAAWDGKRLRLVGAVVFAGNTNGIRVLVLQKNGVAVARQNMPAPSAGEATLTIPAKVGPVATGDYFELAVFQTSGGALNLDPTNSQIYLEATVEAV